MFKFPNQLHHNLFFSHRFVSLRKIHLCFWKCPQNEKFSDCLVGVDFCSAFPQNFLFHTYLHHYIKYGVYFQQNLLDIPSSTDSSTPISTTPTFTSIFLFTLISLFLLISYFHYLDYFQNSHIPPLQSHITSYNILFSRPQFFPHTLILLKSNSHHFPTFTTSPNIHYYQYVLPLLVTLTKK